MNRNTTEYIDMYVYIYIYIERERGERDKDMLYGYKIIPIPLY